MPSLAKKGDSSLARPDLSCLVDNHGRLITYLRLAITDRCNLRCRYCMPEGGVEPIGHDQTLSYEELERLVRVCLGLGLRKVRITGGEPFARKGCMDFLAHLKASYDIDLYLTTNGVETGRYLEQLKAIGLGGINLSLDTLDRQRFIEISRRDRLEQVLETLYRAIELEIPLKINSVVDDTTTDDEILGLAELARRNRLSLRFIEKMPFSGKSRPASGGSSSLIDRFALLFPELAERQMDGVATARQFSGGDFVGSLGIIEGRSRRFCSTCNKIRITPQGILKTCLYDSGVLDVRQLLRSDASDVDIAAAISACVNRRYLNGHLAENAQGAHAEPSMATIGG